MKITIFLIKFLFLGALFIISNNNLALLDSQNREQFYDMYSSWLSQIFNNALALTSYVVKFEWLPGTENFTTIDVEKNDLVP